MKSTHFAISLDESFPTMSDRHYVHHEDDVKLAKILKESRPWLEQYGTTLIYGVAAVVAIAAVGVFIARRPPAMGEPSRGLMLASTPEDYQAVADQSPDSEIGTLARLRQAESSLKSAVENLFANREVGTEELKTAETTFEVLDARSDISAEVRLRVLVGLARISEARCDGTDASTNAAVAAWKKVLSSFPDSTTYKEMAEERIKKLPLESTRSFYTWFQQQNPKPGDDLQLPQDGPGQVPGIPQLDLDSMLKDLTPSAPGAPSGADSSPTDAKSATAPAAAAPATEVPAIVPPVGEPTAAEVPAATVPPATVPPATEVPATEPPATSTGEAPAVPEKSGE